jgi:primosomal protein N' (replication factor Y)
VSSYCDVALRLPLRHWFTYRIPPSLAGFARPGVRALVPLRRETAVGVIGSCHDEEPDYTVRDLVDVVDEIPPFSRDLLNLGTWLSDYYYCSPGEALFAMLPGGLDVRVDTVYHHEPERVPTRNLRPSEKKLCLYLAGHPGASRRELLTEFPQPATAARLEKLVSRGTVAGQRHVRPHRLASLTRKAVQWVGETGGEAKVDRELADYLRDAAEPVAAEVLKSKFPNAPRQLLRLSRRKLVRTVTLPTPYEPVLPDVQSETEYTLTAAQEKALHAILAAAGTHRTFLLHGVTGSGKTEIYIRAIRAALARGGAALYLVPEIGLANHLLERLAPHFRDLVVVLHSGLVPRERALAWRAVHSGERRLVVGTRSAALAPLENLQLVVVDEEQDPSFKQDSPAPRYHGRDVAVWRARAARAVCVLGTATPSLESWHNAERGKYTLLELPERIGARPLPQIHLVDRRRAPTRVRGGLITPVLEERLGKTLAQGGQAILFLNRRGYSGALRCADCGQVCQCPDCAVAYSYHRDRAQLRCHFCGRAEAAPDRCSHCEATEFVYPRAGTQQVEGELGTLFGDARIARLDLDVAALRGRSAELLAQFGRRELDILLGTQMITKGLHFPHVTLVGILNTDLALDLPDFRAAERTVQQVLQVAGRAGRGELPGEVYVQTLAPDQPIYRYIETGEYTTFAGDELARRKSLDYPPHGHLIVVLAQAEKDDEAEAASRNLADRLTRQPRPSFHLAGPAPAPLRRLRRAYRWQLLLKTTNVVTTLALLTQALDGLPAKGARLTVDVDPVHML